VVDRRLATGGAAVREYMDTQYAHRVAFAA
jgi:hypothetical protein